MAYVLMSPLIQAVVGLSARDLQCSPESTGILTWCLILVHSIIFVHCMKVCFVTDKKQLVCLTFHPKDI